jgi:hypothetical protein
VLRWLVGSGIARRAELVAGGNGAAVGNCNPASRWNRRVNKRTWKLQGGLEQKLGACIGSDGK